MLVLSVPKDHSGLLAMGILGGNTVAFGALRLGGEKEENKKRSPSFIHALSLSFSLA